MLEVRHSSNGEYYEVVCQGTVILYFDSWDKREECMREAYAHAISMGLV